MRSASRGGVGYAEATRAAVAVAQGFWGSRAVRRGCVGIDAQSSENGGRSNLSLSLFSGKEGYSG